MPQRIEPKKVMGEGWTEFEVLSSTSSAGLDSRTIISTKNDMPFVDIAIEEYTGISRRAKLTSVRLEEAAARRLYATLAVKFGAPAEASA